jgi:thiol-disulfide isomerase/thioredoxin
MVTPNRIAPGILAAAAVALAVLAAPAEAQLAPGNPFPALAAEGLVGQVPELGGKVLVVDFWASWCAPCKSSFPVYSRLERDFAGRGLVVVGVGVDDTPEAFATFVARLKPGFATLHDSKHALVARVQVPTMPISYVVDRTGKVRFVHAGFHGEDTERELRREIQALLAEGRDAP